MSIKLSLNSSDEELLNVVDKWIDLLAKEEYQKALNFIEHDVESNWTPESLRYWISNYASYEPHHSGQIFQVSTIDSVIPTECESHYRDLDYFDEPVFKKRFNAEVIAEIWYDLPLNNQWSDITATFFVLKREDYLTLILNDIHIM